MRNLSLGIMIGVLLCMAIMSYYPTSQTKLVCGGCGSPEWYSILAEGGE